MMMIWNDRHVSQPTEQRYNNVNKARRYPPADGSSINKIAADLRPSADWSSVHTSLVAGGG